MVALHEIDIVSLWKLSGKFSDLENHMRERSKRREREKKRRNKLEQIKDDGAAFLPRRVRSKQVEALTCRGGSTSGFPELFPEIWATIFP